MSYPCTGCGICCTKAGKAVDQARKLAGTGVTDKLVMEVANFPYNYDETGRCENLQKDNSCAVYEDRPDICKVEKSWEKHYSKKVSIEAYFLTSIKTCNKMITEAGIDKKYLIDG